MTLNRPRFDPGPPAERSAGVRAVRLRPLLTATTTRHPADIPQEDAGSSRPPRQFPQAHGWKDLLFPGIPAYPRSARNHQDRPVTPEVAGSSPVALAKVPAN